MTHKSFKFNYELCWLLNELDISGNGFTDGNGVCSSLTFEKGRGCKRGVPISLSCPFIFDMEMQYPITGFV
jgi:hypothetical protein